MRIILILSVVVALVYGRVGFGPGEQEWGHEKVRDKANMFWWLYYTTADVKNYNERPLLIWLQGGPGASSTGYGNFAELGPLDLDLQPRNYTWVKDANVLFIDNPVGTGFSNAESASGFATTNRQIAEDLVELMRGFYKRLPEFKKTPLYIISESYGGKMAAEFGLLLDEEIKAGKIECNLLGVALGDSWVSPIDSVLTWAPFLLQLGAVDQVGHDKIAAAALKTKELLDAGKFVEATTQWGVTEYVIMNVSHGVDFYNVLKRITAFGKHIKHIGKRQLSKPSTYDEADDKLDKIMPQVRNALNLTQKWGVQSSQTFQKLAGDFMKPATEIVEQLLNSTELKVFVFTGQLDLIVDTPGTVLWVDRLQWLASSKWAVAYRDLISVNGVNEGYRKEVGRLGLYWVNRAGHMVPADNPNAMDYILRKLTNDYDENKNV